MEIVKKNQKVKRSIRKKEIIVEKERKRATKDRC
jgi:hypothetical protein